MTRYNETGPTLMHIFVAFMRWNDATTKNAQKFVMGFIKINNLWAKAWFCCETCARRVSSFGDQLNNLQFIASLFSHEKKWSVN